MHDKIVSIVDPYIKKVCDYLKKLKKSRERERERESERERER